MMVAGVAGAGINARFDGGGRSNTTVKCPGGLARLGNVLSEDANIFPGDPETSIDVVFTVAEDFFQVEALALSTHTGTHVDVPGHFIEGGRLLDDMDASDFMGPAYVIDVRQRVADEAVAIGDYIDASFQLTVKDIRAYEKVYGKIKRGSIVIIQTGWETKWETPAYENDLAPGFSGAAVQWLYDKRQVKGVGSDSFGPDSYSDELFDATYTTLANDGIAVAGLTNVDALDINGDVMLITAPALENGSAYQVDPVACRSSVSRSERPAPNVMTPRNDESSG